MAMMIPPQDCLYNLESKIAGEVTEVLERDVECLLEAGWTLETIKHPILVADEEAKETEELI